MRQDWRQVANRDVGETLKNWQQPLPWQQHRPDDDLPHQPPELSPLSSAQSRRAARELSNAE
jgi:hypothetical protein